MWLWINSGVKMLHIRQTYRSSPAAKHTPSLWPGTHLFSPDLLGELRGWQEQQLAADGRQLLPGSPRREEPKNHEDESHDGSEEPRLSLLHAGQGHVFTLVGGRKANGRSPAVSAAVSRSGRTAVVKYLLLLLLHGEQVTQDEAATGRVAFTFKIKSVNRKWQKVWTNFGPRYVSTFKV